MASFMAAVVQAAAVGFDLDRGLDKVGRLAARRARAVLHLRCSRRRFCPGTRGDHFGAVVGAALARGASGSGATSTRGRCPRAGVDRLAGIAAETALHLVIGVVERDGGTLYCTALFSRPTASWASTAS